MPTPPSITSADSFRFRAQRSDERRTIVVIAAMLCLMGITVGRRLFGGVVMSTNVVFVPTMAALVAVLAYEVFVLIQVRRASRENRLITEWRWWVNAAIELAVPIALLSILHFYSPRGEVAALSAPALLVLPLIIMLSILRLRPKFTLLSGIGAAVAHLALVMFVIISVDPPRNTWPVLLSYSAVLLLCGIAASVVAAEVKKYVKQSVEEAIAAESARQRVHLMERDLSIARDIQRGLLPSSPPDLENFDIAGFSVPADQTGGDYYDWQMLPDGRAAVVLADVTGHGIGPALVMAVCRAYARASAPITPEPHVLLSRLNNLIHADVGGNRFITFALAVVDGRQSRIELLSAGHGPILLYRAAARTIESFGGDGYPLGIVPEGEYSEARLLPMASGDVMLLMTDGFFEWQRPSDNQAFGIERIQDLFKQHAGAAPETILLRMDESVREFCRGAVQNDDMTAVVIKRR